MLEVGPNNKKKFGMSGEMISYDIDFGDLVNPTNLNSCTAENNASAFTNGDLLATFSLQNTNRSFGISIDKPSATGSILSTPTVEDDPALGENWLSLCFNTGGLCNVMVEDGPGVDESTITSLADGLSKVRVVDRLGVNDLDILVCPNNTDVVITVTPSIGWTTP